MMQSDLIALLRAGLAGVVPSSSIDSIEQTQGKSPPYINCSTVGGAQGLTMQGPDGLFVGRVQIECHSETKPGVYLISDAVTTLLHGYRSGPFRLIEHVYTRDLRGSGTNNAERLYYIGLDFIVNWRI